eukprot:CAMPEP_0180220012 /NCGR_PEP_ID=MMETSP0987-20121128/18867_1 /TAXON_ID=697907 /ORGANISM="non described non described, Strain CCMP2293" /LENGTH=177 /DNA_ID=CAMNT_0022180839 /DNA_START=71 /DNA_END=601 /DNA_ORIENTATION=+
MSDEEEEVCVLCGEGAVDEDEKPLFKTLVALGEGKHVHAGCVFWSDELNLDKGTSAECLLQMDKDDTLKVNVQNRNEISRTVESGEAHKCRYCRKAGATLGLREDEDSDVRAYAHLPCTLKEQDRVGDRDLFHDEGKKCWRWVEDPDPDYNDPADSVEGLDGEGDAMQADALASPAG